MQVLSKIPTDLVNFALVTLFAFLIGLEQRKHHRDSDKNMFGTDRTFTLIGVLGYILYYEDKSMKLFIAGGIVLGVLLTIFYFVRSWKIGTYGITSIIIALITYSLAPMVYLAPPWLFMSVLVIALILVESKQELTSFSKRFDKYEFTTLAKFIIIAGVILPLLPNKPIIPGIKITPYEFWLAIVVVSAISYFSYLLKKFVFPQAGIILTAILGGLYSSTATTVILSKKSKGEDPSQISSAIILATGVMYVRIWILALIFNKKTAIKILPFFLVLILLSVGISWYYWMRRKQRENMHLEFEDKNPLEFKTALIFGALFTFFAVLSDLVMKHFGSVGMGILSLIVGVTDIDPYLLSLFQNGGEIATKIVMIATILATASNNIAKMVYAIILGDKQIRTRVIVGFMTLFVVSVIMAIGIYLF